MNFERIRLEELRAELERHAGRWVAIAEGNTVAGAGATYAAAVKEAQACGREFILLKVPAKDATLALPGGRFEKEQELSGPRST